MFTLIQRFTTLILLGFFSFSTLISGASAYSQPNRYSTKATQFVDNYVERMQRGGYSTAEITDALIALRSTYIKRQKSKLYSGNTLKEIEAIIEKLDSAIAGVSEGNCGTCDIYDPFLVVPPTRTDRYTQNNQYYPYTNTNTYSSSTVQVSTTVLSLDTPTLTQTRVDLTLPNVNRDYDMYTFIPQINGSNSIQPSSNRFLSSTLIRELSTQQGRSVGVYFGQENVYDRVRNLRSLAESSTRSSLSSFVLANRTSDAYSSPSTEEFNRHAISSGNTRTYRYYRLYIARDNSNAFLIEYVEKSVGYNSNYNNNYNYNYNYSNNYNPYTGYNNNYQYGYSSTMISGIDTNSFSDYSSYFTHSYRMSNGSKRYKSYIYFPPSGSSVSTVQSNIGMNGRTSYQAGTTRSLYVNNQYTSTTINGYTVNQSSVSSLESTFRSYGYQSSSLSLPGSNDSLQFAPLTGYSYQIARL